MTKMTRVLILAFVWVVLLLSTHSFAISWRAGQFASVPRSNGERTNGTITQVSGDQATVEWAEKGVNLSKKVLLEELKLPKVFFSEKSKLEGYPPHIMKLGDQPIRLDRLGKHAEYKLRILKEVDLCKGVPGAAAAILRKEGLYSSHLSIWKKQRDSGALSALSSKRGRRQKYTPLETEVQLLRKDKVRLEEKLRQAELIVEIQKKVAAMLGVSILQAEVSS